MLETQHQRAPSPGGGGRQFRLGRDRAPLFRPGLVGRTRIRTLDGRCRRRQPDDRLRLVEHLGRLREPEHLGGWLATTARHECLRTLRKSGREVVAFDAEIEIESGEPTPEAVVLHDEQDRLVWLSLGEIPQRCQVLLRALSSTPPPRYDEVSAALGMPIGSIGPTRARCLDHLKSEPGPSDRHRTREGGA